MEKPYYEPCDELDICNQLIERYFQKGDYAPCFRGHLELAEKGYPLAECQVGYFYYDGLGVQQDLTKALYWTERAAKHGNRDGQCNLAWFYEDGIGVVQDLEKAKSWYLRAAWQHHDLAIEKCRELGVAVYRIRFAEEADKESIYALKCQSVRPYVEKIWGWDETYQREDFEKDFGWLHQFYVIEVEGAFAGFLQYHAEGRVFHLSEIHILPKFQGQWIGTSILTQFKEICIAQDRKLQLGCFRENTRGLALYRAQGLVITGETDTHYLLEFPGWKIIPYEECCRDDMIFMVLQAKDALGRVPTLNGDLLDVQANYLDCGDMFWLAIDEQNRVIGCMGYHSIPGTTEVRLHRLYVKADRKRQGIGTSLLHTAEIHLRMQGKTAAHVHLGGKEYFESRSFYPKHGYVEYKDRWMKKELSPMEEEPC